MAYRSTSMFHYAPSNFNSNSPQLIFTTPTQAATFESLSVPLLSILSTKFNQPLLAANNLTFTIKPSPDCGLTSGTTCELQLKDKGLFSFVAMLEKTRERAVYM